MLYFQTIMSHLLRQETTTPGSVEECILDSYGDRELQLIRRVDWRFLFPEPALRRVAYVGSRDEVLLAALGRFSESLTVFSQQDLAAIPEPENHDFDLVIMRSRLRGDLETAVSLLRVGGYFYWEIDRRNWLSFKRKARAGPRFPIFSDYVGFLKPLGFSEIGLQWHFPNFEMCRQMVPLDDPVALGYVLRANNGRALRLKTFLGCRPRILILLRWLLPCISITAKKIKDFNKEREQDSCLR